jgi:hypothetical protein
MNGNEKLFFLRFYFDGAGGCIFGCDPPHRLAGLILGIHD